MLFSSPELAQRRFDELARIEPRLGPLWQLCRRVAPPVAIEVEDFEDEPLTDGWCAEDHFLRHIKPKLVALVGWDRQDDPAELRGRDAYDAAYAALFFHALPRPCACCRDEDPT